MRYEIPTCEIVKLDVTDVISTSYWSNAETPVVGGDDMNDKA